MIQDCLGIIGTLNPGKHTEFISAHRPSGQNVCECSPIFSDAM